MIPIRLAALYVLLTFAMATDAQARDLQLPCSKAKSKEGSVITFYPSEVSWHEIKELGEKILFTSRGVKTVVPPGCPDIGHFTDTFRLPTKEGPLVIIQRVCRQGRSGDERIFTYPEPKLGSSKRRWFTLTIKTFSGPPVVARLEFSKGLVAPFGRREYKMYVRNHEFSMPEDRSLYPRARAVIKKIRNPNDPEELFRAISNATSIREQKKIEHLLYNLGKRILPIVLKKLSDPDPQAKESALVLLRWLPAPLSIGPVATLLKSDSPRIAQQARYTLSILLLRLGKEIESNTTKRTLAVAVLEPFIRELLRDSRYSYSQAWKSRPRWVFLRSRKIFLLPFNVPELPDHTVDTTGLKLKESSRSRRPPQASIHFRYVTPAEWKSEPEKNHPGPALHFHKMKIAGRFARVAISGINDDLAHCNHDWVALFERVNSKWRLLEIERPGGSGLKGISPWMPPLPLREFGDLSPRQIEEFEFAVERTRPYKLSDSRLNYKGLFQYREQHGATSLDERYVPHLRRYQNDKNPTVRAAVLTRLAKLGIADALDELAPLCRRATGYSFKQACGYLIRNVPEAAVEREEILKLMATVPKGPHCGTGVPWYAFERKQHDRKTIEALLDLYRNNSDKTIRNYALGCLRHQKRAELIPLWQEVLSRKPTLKRHALYGLAVIDTNESMRILSKITADKDTTPEDITYIIRVLSDLHLKNRQDFLVSLTYHSSAKVRLAAFGALGSLMHQDTPASLARRAITDTSPAVVSLGLRLLMFKKPLDLIPLIVPLLHHENHVVRFNADCTLWRFLDHRREKSFEILEQLHKQEKWSYSTAPMMTSRYAPLLEKAGRYREAEKAYTIAQRAYKKRGKHYGGNRDEGASMLVLLSRVKRKLGDEKGAKAVIQRLASEYPPATNIYARGSGHQGTIQGKLRDVVPKLYNSIEQPISISISPTVLKCEKDKHAQMKVTISNRSGGQIQVFGQRSRKGNVGELVPNAKMKNHGIQFLEYRRDTEEYELITIEAEKSYSYDLTAKLHCSPASKGVDIWMLPTCELEGGIKWSKWVQANSVTLTPVK